MPKLSFLQRLRIVEDQQEPVRELTKESFSLPSDHAGHALREH